nr:hypothetical protein [Pectobacterium brasiliense]
MGLLTTIPYRRHQGRFVGKGELLPFSPVALDIAFMVQQQLNILEELKDLTYNVNGDDGFILTGCYDAMKPIGENTINKALRKMGYDTKTDLCGHRFRTLECSALIESALA